MTARIKRRTKAAIVSGMAGAQAELDRLERSSENAIQSIAARFRDLAAHADRALKQAAGIVNCVENETVRLASASLDSLCDRVKVLFEKELAAAEAILGTIRREDHLLAEINAIMRQQKAIAVRLQVLSIVTNVEAAHLGSAGEAFQFLAQELSAFSSSVSNQTQELADHTHGRREEIKAARTQLVDAMPRLRGDVAGAGHRIQGVARGIADGLGRLREIPGQFQACMQATTQQIAGIVAGIQSHDITRQQTEHVREALKIIASGLDAARRERIAAGQAHAGLLVQISQLKTIRETLKGWMSQIAGCMLAVERLSTSELAQVGPLVVQHEKDLSLQLSQIDALQSQIEKHGETIRRAESGLSSLFALVNEHIERGESTRDSLKLLTFNSLVEASRLGERGAVVSAIADQIQIVSGEWDALTGIARQALAEVAALVEQAQKEMQAFAQTAAQTLDEGQTTTRALLEDLRRVGALVANEATQMQQTLKQMQLGTADRDHHLDICAGLLDGSIDRIEAAAASLTKEDARVSEHVDAESVERLFAALYTTETERSVMSNQLRGTPLQVHQESFAGNDVELF